MAREKRRNWITIRLLDYDNKKGRVVLGPQPSSPACVPSTYV